MVRKCCGYSSAEWNEVRMWLCCGGSWIFGMILVRLFIHLDFFRLLLFFSPGFVTLAWAPLQQDRSGWRLVTFMAIMLVFYWTLIQAFPVQCRHAWGTRMVIDHDFYTNETAIEEALVLERNNFYYTAGVKHLQKQMFFPPSSKFHEPCVGDNRTKCLFERHSQGSTGTSTDDGTEFKDLITHTDWVNRTHDYARVRNWIRPLTGGLSEDFLLLRAYCNMHRQSPRTVKIYPLKVLGLSPQMINVTVPCPYWSCIMTEAHPGGKLPFGMVLAFFASLNYFHYRCDCLPGRTIQMWFGAGAFRVWWAWFWASLLPLWLAMLIKPSPGPAASEPRLRRSDHLGFRRVLEQGLAPKGVGFGQTVRLADDFRRVGCAPRGPPHLPSVHLAHRHQRLHVFELCQRRRGPCPGCLPTEPGRRGPRSAGDHPPALCGRSLLGPICGRARCELALWRRLDRRPAKLGRLLAHAPDCRGSAEDSRRLHAGALSPLLLRRRGNPEHPCGEAQ
mmetsp:Transcript_92568/g.299292  ORF Transcript_92568/g.299292 Transcript_92568/m.299292 type:complete len:502 (+) Transcript_92568:68-1573(+)